jgi:hypothetical protein
VVDLRLPSLPGDFPTPRRERLRLQDATPYPPKPDWYAQSEPQWVCYWWLSQGRKSRGLPTLRPVGPNAPPERGATFFHEVRIPVLGIFARTEETRVDFLIPGYGGAGYDALAIDPANAFTHPDPAMDLVKRQVLAVQANIQLIWIDTARLEAGDFDVIEAALRGDDQSSLARTGAP